MAFHYDKKKNGEGGNDSFWTSYSDLFLGLSSIFLLLYVTTSLRTGAGAMANQQENQRLSMKVEELQTQLKMYESVKNDYMKEADKSEQQEYQELMDKLVLLQEESKDERDRLARESKENGKKAEALNKYQQMIRNIMNANKVAKTRIVTRDDIIVDKNVEIDTKNSEISSLEQTVEQKKQQIAESERKIANTEAALKNKMDDLKRALKQNKLTKKAYEKQVAAVKEANEEKLEQLRDAAEAQQRQLQASSAKLNELNQSLAETQGQLSQTQGQLSQTQGQLEKTGQELARKGQELKGLSDKLAAKEGEAENLRGSIGKLKGDFAAQAARDKAAFEGALANERLSGAQKAAREAAFRGEAERKAKAMGDKLAGLEGQLRDTEGALAKAKEEIDARKEVAAEIAKEFRKAGVKAEVDGGTGEVILDFGDAYFDSGKSDLKPQMTAVLDKAMPSYARSLFGNPKVASKISNVEIIGFASPTYKGRFVDPSSSKPEDRAALKYNMDLSYQRANAIFKNLVDRKGAKDFQYQENLQPLMKVSGRSFLEVMDVKDRSPASAAEFCRVNDCKKAQRVIIRFSMDGKKK